MLTQPNFLLFEKILRSHGKYLISPRVSSQETIAHLPGITGAMVTSTYPSIRSTKASESFIKRHFLIRCTQSSFTVFLMNHSEQFFFQKPLLKIFNTTLSYRNRDALFQSPILLAPEENATKTS